MRNADWLNGIPGGSAIVVMEGVSMYLSRGELKRTLSGLCGHLEKVDLLMDCYTEFAAKASRFKNPINDVGVTEVYGLDDPNVLCASGLVFVREHEMTPADLVDQLRCLEKRVFRKLYAGKLAGKMYRLYEFHSQ